MEITAEAVTDRKATVERFAAIATEAAEIARTLRDLVDRIRATRSGGGTQSSIPNTIRIADTETV
jgi:hypothetical protein